MTALQEFIKLSTRYTLLLNERDSIEYNLLCGRLLEQERQQIARAFDMADNINTGTFTNGLDYYEQEYE